MAQESLKFIRLVEHKESRCNKTQGQKCRPLKEWGFLQKKASGKPNVYLLEKEARKARNDNKMEKGQSKETKGPRLSVNWVGS